MFVAIETSTDVGSVAVGTGTDLAGEVVVGIRSRHAESLLPALDFLLRTTRIGRGELEGIVVGAGPGSFTGVRVAAATARGLAHGLGVPLLAFSSLEALALDSVSGGPVCALFDARRGEVYAACYGPGDGADRLATLIEPAVLTVAELLERVAAGRPMFVGEGAVRYRAELGTDRVAARWPRASALLRLAGADAGRGRISQPRGWEPSYLRASGAERGIAG
jgi:tRNA threonylcarbamoyladenosine biosynthesis protein TsaB